MARKKLVVSLVTYNGEAYMRACLDSVIGQTFSDIELVIFDNASKDKTLEIIDACAPHARIIVSPDNIGFCAGHNAVIRNTDSDYILVLNQDVILKPDYCERLVAFLDKNSDYGVASGLLVSEMGQGLTKSDFGATVDTCGIRMNWAQRPANIGAGEPISRAGDSREVWGVSAAAALYRRSSLEDIALTMEGEERQIFDEDFFMYHDDSDVSYRLRWRGWRAWFDAKAIAAHARTRRDGRGEFFKRTSKQINYWSYRNRWFFLIKNASKGILLRSGLAIFVFEAAKLVYLVLFERDTLKALGKVKSGWARMKLKRAMIMDRRTVNDAQMREFFSLR